jgi:hypothetical protein
MLGSGATQIRCANYATKGVYFQAFTSLSTGLERIGKLCLMLDHYIETNGQFPDFNALRRLSHNLVLIYQKSREISARRATRFTFLRDLEVPIHQNVLSVLSGFAEGDRYTNINLLVGKTSDDPVAQWFEEVDRVLFDKRVTNTRKARIASNARLAEELMGSISHVCHSSETGSDITSIEEGSYRTGMFEAVAPHRQFVVLQIIRYWVELLYDLQYKAQSLGKQEIPFFGDIFGLFYNEDTYLRSRKTWDRT